MRGTRMDKDDTPGRTDGGHLEARAQQESEPAQEDLPALGLIADDDFGVIQNLMDATDLGIDTYLVDTPDSHPVIERLARRLGATTITAPIEDPSTDDLENVLSTYAQADSAPGIIIPDDSATPIDLERSLQRQDEGSFIVEPVTEKETQAPAILVAIPAYNEAKTIADVVQEARRFASKVIVVDDGSTDETVWEAKSAGAEVIRHEQNKGYGSSLQTAFNEAAERNADHLVILDGDGQHDPTDIPTAIDCQMTTDADIVIGSRFGEGSNTKLPLYRRFGIEVVNTLTNLTMGVVRPRSWVRDTQSGFRTYNEHAIESLSEDSTIGDGMSASTDILHHAHHHGLDIEEFGTTVNYDVENASSQNPLSHGVTLVMNLVQTIERDRPITTLGIPGFLSSFVGLGFGYWTFHHYIQSGTFPIGLAVTSTFFALAGIFACFTAIILHSLNTHLNE